MLSPVCQPTLQIPGKPFENETKTLQPVARLSRPRHLMILVWKAYEHHVLALLLQGNEQLLGLLHGATQVVLRMHNEERRGDVFGVGKGSVVDVPLQVL